MQLKSDITADKLCVDLFRHDF